MDSLGLFWIKVQWREGWNNCTGPKWGLPAPLPACLGPIYPPNLHLNLHLNVHLHLKFCSTFGGIVAQYGPVAPSICPGKVQPPVIHHFNCYIELCNHCIWPGGYVGMPQLPQLPQPILQEGWSQSVQCTKCTKCAMHTVHPPSFCTCHLNVHLKLCNDGLIAFGQMGWVLLPDWRKKKSNSDKLITI